MLVHNLSYVIYLLFFFTLSIDVLKGEKIEKATFAGGCFWCLEAEYEKYGGIIEVVSGYTGGNMDNPSYREVSGGDTGHLEAVELTYNPDKISYETLLELFFKQIDPTDDGGQFVDRGSQYQTAIFYHNLKQEKLAKKALQRLAESGYYDQPIVTKALPVKKFYDAEGFHQNYYKEHPERYKRYKYHSGRGRYVEDKWGEGKPELFKVEDSKRTFKERVEEFNKQFENFNRPNDQELKSKLDPLQYKVSQSCSTELAFSNTFWNNKAEGIYVDIVSGEPLFSSMHKYQSGSGWPSFFQPLVDENIIYKEESGNGIFNRTEVRSRYADSHLGHIFTDGPKPTGKRYCINSASLRFIAKEDLKKEGYELFIELFK